MFVRLDPCCHHVIHKTSHPVVLPYTQTAVPPACSQTNKDDVISSTLRSSSNHNWMPNQPHAWPFQPPNYRSKQTVRHLVEMTITIPGHLHQNMGCPNYRQNNPNFWVASTNWFLQCVYELKWQTMQLCCHAAMKLDKHAYIMGQNSKQCRYVAMQLRKLRCIFYEPRWQTMQLCCHAAAELDKHAYIMGQSSKQIQLCCHAAVELDKHAYIMAKSSRQCSYVAMQLQNLTNIHIFLLLWVKVASNTAMWPCSSGTWQTCIYVGQSRKQCSYVAIQLQNLVNMYMCMRHMSSWVNMQLQNLLASHLNKRIVKRMQPRHHAAAESKKHEYNMGHLSKPCRFVTIQQQNLPFFNELTYGTTKHMQLCYRAAEEHNKIAYSIGGTCSFYYPVAVESTNRLFEQLYCATSRMPQFWKVAVYYGSLQQAMQYCYHATAESAICNMSLELPFSTASYVAMQLQIRPNMHILWAVLVVVFYVAVELKKL